LLNVREAHRPKPNTMVLSTIRFAQHEAPPQLTSLMSPNAESITSVVRHERDDAGVSA
jgi:hypothetical protein